MPIDDAQSISKKVQGWRMAEDDRASCGAHTQRAIPGSQDAV
jgi:hypothetical protein